jgi:hypothetical protein
MKPWRCILISYGLVYLIMTMASLEPRPYKWPVTTSPAPLARHMRLIIFVLWPIGLAIALNRIKE